jgi:ATP-dependent Clp protease ATP-binding subunit ClpA
VRYSISLFHALGPMSRESPLTSRLQRHNIDLTWDDRVVHILVGQYNIHYGARSLQHAVNRVVINKLAKAHEEVCRS